MIPFDSERGGSIFPIDSRAESPLAIEASEILRKKLLVALTLVWLPTLLLRFGDSLKSGRLGITRQATAVKFASNDERFAGTRFTKSPCQRNRPEQPDIWG